MSEPFANVKIYDFTEDDVKQMYSAVKSNGDDPISGLRVFFAETGRNPTFDEVYNLWYGMAMDCAKGEEAAQKWLEPRQNFTTEPAKA